MTDEWILNLVLAHKLQETLTRIVAPLPAEEGGGVDISNVIGTTDWGVMGGDGTAIQATITIIQLQPCSGPRHICIQVAV